MSRLEQLPQVLRRKILGYLLISGHVRQPPNHLLVEHYVFEVNILRTNQAINGEALAVLYQENTFIKVYNDFVDAETAMRNHEVPFFKLKSKFEHHVAEVSINLDPMNKRLPSSMRLKQPAPVLLVLADMPKYTRLLRLLDFANFMAYKFDFKIHLPPYMSSPLSTKDQTNLLVPFEQVRGVAMTQKVSFSGAFEPTIVKRVKQAMTSKIAWLRAGAWEIHDIALSIKRMGDWAFRLNDADTALAKYDDTRTFIVTAMKMNSMMRGLDAEFDKALCGMECTVWVDTALLMLSDTMLKENGRRAYDAIPNMTKHIEAVESRDTTPIVPVSVLARFYHLLGIAELGLDHPVKAAKAFVKSYSMVTEQTTKDGYDVATGWKDLGKKAKTSRLNSLFASMPKEPLAISDMKEYTTPEVSSEHWVMRELGYQGTFPYEDKIKGAWAIILTNKPHRNHHNQGPRTAQVGPVKPEVLRKVVEKYRKNINQPLAQGRLIGWVGLNVDEIGEETILDHDGVAVSMKALNIGNRACNPQ
ncbi:Nn.00g103810.m01.CDS01 [Neocucurbitaria sp. VM-36]